MVRGVRRNLPSAILVVMKFSRRQVLGGAAAAALLSSCGGTPMNGAEDDAGPRPDSGPMCTVYPQETQGPFYLNLNLLRTDITEGKPGVPLLLQLLVQRSDCSPLAGVAVDVWQCDAGGVYSGYPNQLGGVDTTGMTFLRGTQITGGDGRAAFTTIYPGWYPGRTTHIHFMVHPTASMVATSQLYFPEDVTAAVYALDPYAAHGPKDTPNTSDGVFLTGTSPPLAGVTGDPSGYTLAMTINLA
jgi:protocatechuate 3,4-dioxygenase beta subunit